MQIKVACREDAKYEEEIDVDSLTYNCKTAAFEMQAAGYVIPLNESCRPVRLYGRGTSLFVSFEKPEEAKSFSEWLRTANRQAKGSLDSMFEY